MEGDAHGDAQEIRSGTIEELSCTVGAGEPSHHVPSTPEVCFTWSYDRARPQLSKLYEKAKTSMWNVATDIDWNIDVDPARIARDPSNPLMTTLAVERVDNVFEKLSDEEWYDIGAAAQAWTLSQFMHGEQGALLCASQIVETVPWIDAKYYAATQVMDEARHVEVYSRYLTEKLGQQFPVNLHLQSLLDQVVNDPRWDMTYLGMQIMIEGLALAAFGFQYTYSIDPLLKQITRFVMADEARHVAFGVLSLKEAYANLSGPEVRERQEFCYEAALQMRDRFLSQEVWEWAGLPVKECCQVMLDSPVQREFRKLLFSKIVPNLKKLGLLDAGDGWLRERFADLGVLQFEDWEDTGAEFDRLQLDATA
jgi:hypothetical protein